VIRSEARNLLDEADREGKRLRRHLLAAAALSLILEHRPIVVGGTAEDYWTDNDYVPTDLDMCAPISKEDERRLANAGFKREGRHWFREGEHPIAVEFPEARIEGEEQRAVEVPVGSTTVRVIGVEDLYLDRIRQSTATPEEDSEPLAGAVAIASARYERMDWRYVTKVIRSTLERDPPLGALMQRIDRRVRTRVRRALSGSGF